MKKLAAEFLHRCGLTDADRELIRLYALHGAADPDDLSAWFAAVDFEALSPECVCMAAVLCAENGYRGVPESLLPRLKGILRYHRMLNSGLYAAMCGLIRVYNQHGIDVLALKGAAIKTGYRPNFVRPMWDVDILVRPADYDRALELAHQQGYTGTWSPHSIDLKRGSTEAIDLHCVYLRDLKSRKHRDFWPQSREICWNDAKFHVPQRCALLLQLMVNAHNNFARHLGVCFPLRWVMDMEALLHDAEPFDWDAFLRLTKELQLQPQVAILLQAYETVLPGRLDAEGLLRRLGRQAAAKRMLRTMDRYRRIHRDFRDPPPNCSALQLARIHIRFLWADCRTENPGSLLHGLRCFPAYLRSELRVKSLLQLPAEAIRKIRKHRSTGF